MAVTSSETVAGFLAHARSHPDAAALVWHGTTTSYGELAELAAEARARIDLLDLAAGEPLGVVATKSPAAIALTLAGLGAGRAVLLPSTTLAPPALAAVLDQAGCRSLLSPDPGEGVLGGGSQAPGPRSAGVADGTAFVLATSGSTGIPKVVPLGHGAVDRFTRWAAGRFGIGVGTAVLNYAPLNFDLCLLDIWATLRFGGTVVLVDPDRGTDGAHLWNLIDARRVAVVQSVPMVFRLLVDAGTSARQGLTSVEHVIVTGDALPVRTLAELPGLFPTAQVHNVYGCTETNDSFVHDVTAADVERAEPLPLGQPIDGVDALIVGPDGSVVTGPGRGELYVATPFQTDGYLDPRLNAAKFAAHPQTSSSGGGRYFRSGDLVRRTDDGRIVLEGRDDFQVKVRGVAVNTAEVERVLLDHPQVAEAAVVAVADHVAGKRLHAAVRRCGAERLNSLALRRHLAGQLVTAAIPSTFRIADEPLPKTSTGKVDRRTVAHALAGANQQGE